MPSTPRLLVLTATAGYRHGPAIEAGVTMLRTLADRDGVELLATEDPAALESGLDEVAAVVFHQVSGDVLSAAGRAALARAVRGGCGFAGIHSASTAEPSWPGYLDLVGARFAGHPQGVHPSVLDVVGPAHPSTAHLPSRWAWTDEWYAFEAPPTPTSTVLLTVDESTYSPSRFSMPGAHPICWAGSLGAGRTWYSALGHEASAYADPLLQDHLWGGITSVLRPSE